MLSVVNGYLCYSSCDVKRAAQGKNPHVPDGTTDSAAVGKRDTPSAFDGQPATVLDGALKARSGPSPVTATNSTSDSPTSNNSADANRQQVDVLA
jgi:hypothetical protein